MIGIFRLYRTPVSKTVTKVRRIATHCLSRVLRIADRVDHSGSRGLSISIAITTKTKTGRRVPAIKYFVNWPESAEKMPAKVPPGLRKTPPEVQAGYRLERGSGRIVSRSSE
jgi:hypothetical protein